MSGKSVALKFDETESCIHLFHDGLDSFSGACLWERRFVYVVYINRAANTTLDVTVK